MSEKEQEIEEVSKMKKKERVSVQSILMKSSTHLLLGMLIGTGIGTWLALKFECCMLLLLGICGGLMFGAYIAAVLYYGDNKEELKDLKSDVKPLNNKEWASSYVMQMKKTLELRVYAAQRLHTNDFWIQIINIYYSCFTAAIAVLSLKDEAQQLAVYSAVFTVMVAILVTFANAQRYDHRANDLKANCIDIRKSILECQSLWEKQEQNDANALQEKIGEYIKKLGDSEDASIVDIWKYKGKEDVAYRWIYLIGYAIPVMLLIILFLLIPIIFVIKKYDVLWQIIDGSYATVFLKTIIS